MHNVIRTLGIGTKNLCGYWDVLNNQVIDQVYEYININL